MSSSTTALVETGSAPVKQAGCSLLAKIIISVAVSAVVVAGAASAGYFLTVNSDSADNVLGASKLNTSTTTIVSGETTTSSSNGQTTKLSVDQNTGSGGQQTDGLPEHNTADTGVPGQTTRAGQSGNETGKTTNAGNARQSSAAGNADHTTGAGVIGQNTDAGGPEQSTRAEQITDNVTSGRSTDSGVNGQDTGPTNSESNTGSTFSDLNNSGTTELPADGDQSSSSDANIIVSTSIVPVPTTTAGPTCPTGFSRTVFFLEYTGPSDKLWLRGGVDIPLVHLESPNDNYNMYAQGDTVLDWDGKEPGQPDGAQGTPTYKASGDNSSTNYHPLSVYGDDYWLTDACMDCSSATDNRFHVKMYTNAWEDVGGGNTGCFNGGNHFAYCGKINVFRYGMTSCQIHGFPPS